MYIVSKKLFFPPVEEADQNGLLALGGDLSMQRLLLAYRSGIFPWFNEDDPVCWWSPDPRFVMFSADLKVSKSMQVVLRKNEFQFTCNEGFADVISHCKNVHREGQGGTWITDEMQEAYINLHRQGYAHSAEAWHNGELVGGLYGIRLGNIFFGESMFSLRSNASKFAFIRYVQQLQKENVELVDCQLHTAHLESLGAKMISRAEFRRCLKENL